MFRKRFADYQLVRRLNIHRAQKSNNENETHGKSIENRANHSVRYAYTYYICMQSIVTQTYTLHY